MSSGSPLHVAAVVVTFNRKDSLKKNIQCLLQQTRKIDKIYIIDNASTDGTGELADSFPSNVCYERLSVNSGGSGGFSFGVKKAYQEGADLIWGMDDDAYPDKKALEELMKVYDKGEPDVCLWSNCNKDLLFEKEYKQVYEWMFVGFLVPCTVIKKVGLPRNDMFIYYDDIEYARRISSAGFKILKVRDSVIDHMDAPSKCICKIKLGHKVIEVPSLPKQKWRLYYLIRNRILINSSSLSAKRKVLFGPVLRSLFKVILFQPGNLPVFLKAVHHGISGKYGKTLTP